MSKLKKAAAWTTIGYFLNQLIRLGSNLILTRLLVPEAFALISMTMVIWIGITMVSDIGLQHAIVQNKKGEEQKFRNTVWTMQIARGLLIWAICILLSFILAMMQKAGFFAHDSVYSSDLLPNIIMVCTFCAVIDGFRSVDVYIAQRHMHIGPITAIDLLSQIVATSLTVFLASIYHSPWAIVAGIIGQRLSHTVASHFLMPKNKLWIGFHKEYAIELFHFGKWLTVSAFMTFLGTQGDRLVFAMILTAKDYGIYTIAALLFESLKALILKMLSNITLPVLSDIHRKNDSKALVFKYYKLRSVFDPIILFISGFLAVTADIIINILYTDTYSSGGKYLTALSFALIFSIFYIKQVLFLATAKTSYLSSIQTIRVASLFLTMFVLYHNSSPDTVVYAVVISSLFEAIASMYYGFKDQVIDFKREFLFLPVFLIGAGAGKAAEYVYALFF